MGFIYRMFTLLQLLQVFQPSVPTCTHFTEIVPRLYHSYLRRNKLSFIRKEVERAVTTGQYLCCTLKKNKKKAYFSLPLSVRILISGSFSEYVCIRMHSEVTFNLQSNK